MITIELTEQEYTAVCEIVQQKLLHLDYHGHTPAWLCEFQQKLKAL
jgi:hypothetical protein